MIGAPLSVLHSYTLIDETDDALARPESPPDPRPLDGEAPADFEARKDAHAKSVAAAEAEFIRRFEVACETGDWRGLIVDGRTPTFFHVRQIPMTAWNAFKRVARSLGTDEIATLAFRLGVTEITNLNLGVATKVAPYVGDDGKRERALGDVLDEAIPNAISMAPGGRDVVLRIGVRIMQQRGAPLGK